MLSDLRESGAIEQDADIVCFIHRPEYYNKSGVDAQGNDIRGMAELIVAKHRSGGVGDVKLRFVPDFVRFENWEEGYRAAQNAMASLTDGSDTTGLQGLGTVTLQSRFNSEAADLPMPDIMPDPGESGTPF